MPTVIDVENGSFESQTSLIDVNGATRRQKTGRQTYIVLSDNLTQDQTVIEATSPLPQMGTVVSGMTCVRVSSKEDTRIVHPVTGVPAILWKVQTEFDSSIKPDNDTIPKVRWGGELDKVHFDRDVITGARVQTTAGEPIFSEREIPQPILRITRRETYPFNPNTQLLYGGRVNKTSFYGAPRGTAMMMPIEVDEEYHNNTKVCIVEYTIKFKLIWDWTGNLQPDTWQSQPINNGFMVREQKGAQAAIKGDVSGNPMRFNLDFDGTKLTDQEGLYLDLKKYDAPLTFGGSAGAAWIKPSTGENFAVTSLHVGSFLSINAQNVNWTNGLYLIVGYQVFNGNPCWIVNPAPSTLVADDQFLPLSTDITKKGWKLVRSPLYLYFNRFYPAEFNALNLGPFN